MRVGAITFYICVALLLLVRGVAAQELPPYKIVPDGREYEIRMGPNERSLKTISVFFESTGNISKAVVVDVSGPGGIVGTVRGGLIVNNDAVATLGTGAGVQNYKIRHYPNKTEASRFVTESQADDSSYGYKQAWFHLQKDACNPNKQARYVAQVKLNLTGVNPALYDSVFSIVISVRELKFSGKMAASIKPSSDGKYFGEPILLMSTAGFGGEYVNKVTWKGGRVVATKRIPIVKYVGYMGYILSLARIKGVLQGGLHTWELSDGGNIYGVCLKAVRKRQRVNGYPGSG